jgi:glycerol-3-phosphate acyltransferase PlsY
MITALLIWILSYLLGCIPFGVLFARKNKINLREHGSGNIGATNVSRVLGKKAGILTLLGDLSKGVAAVALASYLLDSQIQIAISGLMVFIGHVYPVFLKFKGGKGVATGLGVFLFLMPWATVCVIGVFAVTLKASGYVSLSSVLAALFLPLFGIFFQYPPEFMAVSVPVALIVLHRHHENMQRILDGSESRFLKK